MYSRTVNGQTLTFGVSGKLWKNALVMYDRETGTLWSHLTGEALQGPLSGGQLEMVSAMPKIKWKDWKAQHPTTRVLTVRGRESLHTDRYADYHLSDKTGLFEPETRDIRLGRKDMVIAVTAGALSKAYPLQRKHWKTGKKDVWKLIQDRIGEIPVVIFHNPQRYATAVYDRKRLDGDPLVFEESAEGYMARDGAGNLWNLLTGKGPEGQQLTPIPHVNIYWFAWVDFYPETLLYPE